MIKYFQEYISWSYLLNEYQQQYQESKKAIVSRFMSLDYNHAIEGMSCLTYFAFVRLDLKTIKLPIATRIVT